MLDTLACAHPLNPMVAKSALVGRVGMLQCAIMADDPFNLRRFVEAQESAYPNALAEIMRGAKRGHWMWFIFPQLRGLGRSETAHRFGITSLDEARAYLLDPILGQRLRECVAAVQELTSRTVDGVFGEVDAMKLRSSLTLFIRAGGGPNFEAALNRWFGEEDPRTLELLGVER